MKIGPCVFLKIGILGKNWAWGRFLGFCAGFRTYVVLKFAVMEAISSLTRSRNLSILSEAFARNSHLNSNLDTTIELCTGKVRWLLYLWIGSSKEHSKEYYGQTNCDKLLEFLEHVDLVMFFTVAQDSERKYTCEKSWKTPPCLNLTKKSFF